MSYIPIITIDGPSGSGKGTISWMLAKKLKWNYLDSGALYRTLAYYVEKHKIDLNDIDNLVLAAQELPVTFKAEQDSKNPDVYLEKELITPMIRTENCGAIASKIAAIPEVRKALVNLQHSFLKSPGLVTDGRDMGTVIFPNADVKIFLDASASERAKRRFFQLKERNINVNLNTLVEEINLRDERDKNRAISPLVSAAEAYVIDTSSLDIEQVFTEVFNLVTKKILVT